MNVVAIGIDIVETARVAAALDRFGDRFRRRLFLGPEIDYCRSMPRPELHYAARFAAKEAVAKAFGTGIGPELGWRDIEIGREPNGRPVVQLSEKARHLAGRLGIDHVEVSLSHTDAYAAAQAVALGPGLPPRCVGGTRPGATATRGVSER